LAIERELLGPQHPLLAGTLRLIGTILYAARDYAAARDAFVEAIELVDRGQATPDMANHLDFLANALFGLRQYDEAAQQAERALEIRVDTLGPDHAFVGDSHQTLAQIELARGDLAAAREHGERALEIRRRTRGPRHYAVADTMQTLTKILLLSGRDQEGLELAEESLSIATESFGPDHPNIARFLYETARAQMHAGQYDEALKRLERARAIQDRDGAAEPEARAEVQLAMGQAIAASRGDLDRARKLVVGARELFGGRAAQNATELAQVDRFLAKLDAAKSGDAVPVEIY
jgi:nephrocystin-3